MKTVIILVTIAVLVFLMNYGLYSIEVKNKKSLKKAKFMLNAMSIVAAVIVAFPDFRSENKNYAFNFGPGSINQGSTIESISVDIAIDSGNIDVRQDAVIPGQTAEISIANDWYRVNGRTCYINEFGNAVKGWHFIDNSWYYFGEDCVMLHSTWFEYKSDWYYLHGDGSMAYSTTIDGYVIDKEGKWVNKKISEPTSSAVIESSSETVETTKAVVSEIWQVIPPKQTTKPTESVIEPPTQKSTQPATTVENQRELYQQYFQAAEQKGYREELEARPLYEKALDYAVTDDEFSDALYGIGSTYYLQGDFDTAIAYLSQALKYKPTILIYSTMADCYWSQQHINDNYYDIGNHYADLADEMMK